jgi:hypothetical protein
MGGDITFEIRQRTDAKLFFFLFQLLIEKSSLSLEKKTNFVLLLGNGGYLCSQYGFAYQIKKNCKKLFCEALERRSSTLNRI